MLSFSPYNSPLPQASTGTTLFFMTRIEELPVWTDPHPPCTSTKEVATTRTNSLSTLWVQAFVGAKLSTKPFKPAMRGVELSWAAQGHGQIDGIWKGTGSCPRYKKKTHTSTTGTKFMLSIVMEPNTRDTDRIQFSTREKTFISEAQGIHSSSSTTSIKHTTSTTKTPSS